MAFEPGEAPGPAGDRAAEKRVEGVERVAAIGPAGSDLGQGETRQGIGIEDIEQGADEIAVVGVEGAARGAVERVAFEGGQIHAGQGLEIPVQLFGDVLADKGDCLRRRGGGSGTRQEDGQEGGENAATDGETRHGDQ